MANLELIENYPGFAEPVSGAQLMAGMINQAMNYGLTLEQVAVTGMGPVHGGYRVICSDGRVFTSRVLIVASGTRHKKLGVLGEDLFQGRGVFSCALCDGGKFSGKVVAVCGGGDAGVTEALYMTKLASKVILIEAMPSLTACGILKERLLANKKIDLRCGTRVLAISGKDQVEEIKAVDSSGKEETIKVSGVLVHIGLVPNKDFLNNKVPLDETGHIIVNEKMETRVPHILAAGDVRSGSPNQIVTATGDGATAGITADRLLQQLV